MNYISIYLQLAFFYSSTQQDITEMLRKHSLITMTASSLPGIVRMTMTQTGTVLHCLQVTLVVH